MKNSPTWIPTENPKRNPSEKEEFTCVNPCRDSDKKLLGEGRIHLVNPCRESDKKPLGKGPIHLRESLPRVRWRNLSQKEEFTYVNPCRESNKKPLCEGSIHLRESFLSVR